MKIYQRNEQLLQNEHSRDVKTREEQAENGVPILFLQKGKTTLRVLPPYSDAGVWYREIQEHGLRIAGRFQTFSCPRPYGQVCPICDAGQALYSQGTPEAIEEARRFKPQNRFLFNVLVMSDPKGKTIQNGVCVLKAGVGVKRDLLDIDTDVATGWGNITDCEAGVNISIDRVGDGLETKYVVKGFAQRTNIVEHCAQSGIDFNALELFNLDLLFPPRSEDELKAALEGRAVAPGFPTVTQPVTQAALPQPAPPAAQPAGPGATVLSSPRQEVAPTVPVPQPIAVTPAPAPTATVPMPTVAPQGPTVVGMPVPVPNVPAPPPVEDDNA